MNHPHRFTRAWLSIVPSAAWCASGTVAAAEAKGASFGPNLTDTAYIWPLSLRTGAT
jgi:hypothetical protein